MAAVAKEPVKYQFFSEADIHIDPKTGRKSIASEYPMWYNPNLITEMEDEVSAKEIALQTGQVPRSSESDYRDNLARMKDHLEKMKNMTMVDDARNDKDELGKAVKELSKIIREELPSEDLCKRNLVDPNQEMRKMTVPYIKLSSDNMAELARACNVPISDGKVSREGASKMWKIATKFLGEYANTDILRRL